MVRALLIVICAGHLLACSKKPAPAAAVPAPTAAAVPEPAPQAVTAEDEPEASVLGAPDAATVSDTSADTAQEEPQDVGPARTAQEVVAALESALDAMATCDRVIDSPFFKSPSACLGPVHAARVDVRNPTTEVAPDANARAALRSQLAAVARAHLETEDATLLLYTLQALGSDFDEAPPTRARLEQLMAHEVSAVASAAAAARLSRPRESDKASQALALKLVKGDGVPGVRAAACRYLGDEVFRGKKAYVTALSAVALKPVEDSRVRGTAVARLGFIGSDADIKTLERLFRVPSTQYAAAFTIQQGLRSEKAFEALVTWLEGEAKGDRTVQWGTLSAVAPRPEDLAKFPAKRAIKALSAILNGESHQLRTRAACAGVMGVLGGEARLKVLLKRYKGKSDPASVAIVEAIETALAKKDTGA